MKPRAPLWTFTRREALWRRPRLWRCGASHIGDARRLYTQRKIGDDEKVPCNWGAVKNWAARAAVNAPHCRGVMSPPVSSLSPARPPWSLRVSPVSPVSPALFLRVRILKTLETLAICWSHSKGMAAPRAGDRLETGGDTGDRFSVWIEVRRRYPDTADYLALIFFRAVAPVPRN